MPALQCDTSYEQREGQAGQEAARQMAQMHGSRSLWKNTMRMNSKEMQLAKNSGGVEPKEKAWAGWRRNFLHRMRQDQLHKIVRKAPERVSVEVGGSPAAGCLCSRDVPGMEGHQGRSHLCAFRLALCESQRKRIHKRRESINAENGL